jgi:hypothetical protein
MLHLEQEIVIDLPDTTFLLVIQVDSPERLQCLDIVLRFIHKHFVTNVKVWELRSATGYQAATPCAQHPRTAYACFEDPAPYFYITKWVNRMIDHTTTPVVIVMGADVILDPAQVVDAVESVRRGATFAVPYQWEGGWCFMTPQFRNDFGKDLDWNLTSNPIYLDHAINALGGIYAASKKLFRNMCGGENEDMKGYCASDVERLVRVTKLGYEVHYSQGRAYHLDHPRGESSSGLNPDGTLTELSKEMDTLQYRLRFEVDRREMQRYLDGRPWYIAGKLLAQRAT